MSLRVQLTLWSVLVMGLIVGVVAAVDLAQEVKHQFDATLDRAEFYQTQVAALVQGKANRDRTVSSQDALRRDPDLARELLNLMTASKSLYEIAVCDPQNIILSDSVPEQIGAKFPSYPDFERLVNGGVIQKTTVLLRNSPEKYQLSKGLGVGNKPEIYVRVVVWPGLIQKDMIPTIWQHAELSAFLFSGAILAAFLFSAIAFRPIGKLGHMLDLLMSGEYDNQQLLPATTSRTDEFEVVASKVNLLGQQLRGAQYDFSDLRGNFERLLDDLEDAVLVFGRDRRLVVTAGAVEKFLGRARSELMGRALVEVFPPSTSLGLLLQQAAQTGLSIRNRRVPMDAGGNGNTAGVAVALLSVDVLEALQSGIVTGAAAGILVRLRDPEATRQIGRQLQIADRVSAISRITGGVAHEVKNPLNAILMHVELARMKLATGDSDLKPQMDIIASEIVRLDRVVKTFLDFTKPVELHPADVPLEAFVNDIAELARPLAETGKIEVHVEQQTEGTSVSVDLDLLKQAMVNVVINAIEAMPDGGQLRFQSSVNGQSAEIRISDTGCGIPAGNRAKIFGLYFTTKEKGSGIGLAMTFRIVQLHDGTIDFTSEPGKGTTFVICLPMAVSSD